MRLLRLIVHTAAAVCLIMTTMTVATGAAHANIGVTANCDGRRVSSAAHVKHTGSGIEIGSIQLCKYYENPYKPFFFARIQMYSSLQYGEWANAYLQTFWPDGTVGVITCDDWSNPPNGIHHVGPGETTCRTPAKYSYSTGIYLRAVGRAYRADGGGGWRLFGEGMTAKMPQS